MKATGILSLTHERVELIPLLLGCRQRQNSPILLERHRGSREPARPCLGNRLAVVPESDGRRLNISLLN